jgi:D-3-phosphoglycerate dehydrogenase
MGKTLITTVPFGDKNRLPFDLLEKAGIEYTLNPYHKKLTEDELAGLIGDYDTLIAGTEIISDKVMARAPKLKLISRVGIGLDGVDLVAAKKRGIQVSYTPDAPAPAVAELTLGLMLTLARSLHTSNKQLHEKKWQRIFGRRLEEMTIGLIGMGRIGTRVLTHLQGFGVKKVLLNDLTPNTALTKGLNVEWVSKEKIYQDSDIISLHLPLNSNTRNLITEEHLRMMKSDAIVINTARGGIINEADLYKVLKDGHLGAAGIDVFEQEPYSGPLSEIERCFLTAHMGSMSVDCRTKMEIEATEEVVRFHNRKKLEALVPEIEYELQGQRT